ncbi:dienelactone hydrolase family protein [Bacillus spongiae]|uniref:Dienelactone hydrolase family protein n=1 Tax=Bacillus spongiae TaxID=2683610 RepID=A0ABU8HJ70_9BACI
MHGIIEGIRWQFYPVYFVIIIQFISALSGWLKERKRRKRVGAIISALGILASTLLSFAFPVYKMPTPSGENQIGTVSFNLIDPEREAIYSGDLSKNRKIKMQVWYPAQKIDGYEQVPWLEDGRKQAEGVSKMMGFPDFVLSHTALVQSNSYRNAPLSDVKDHYPVVILSHGWTGFRNIHTDVAELLASNGYVVIGIDHTYGSAVTVFNDKEIAYVKEEALPDREETPDFLNYAQTLVTTFAGDISLSLNELEGMNKGERDATFTDRLDLENIGIVGHSTGGGAAVSTAIHDKRIKAIVGMDAWVEPVEKGKLETGLQIPSLFLRSNEWEHGLNNDHLFFLLNNSERPVDLYQINETGHQDFSMIYMYSPLSKYFNITGKLDGREGAKIQHDFILNFFDSSLKNQVNKTNEEVSNQYEHVQLIYSDE